MKTTREITLALFAAAALFACGPSRTPRPAEVEFLASPDAALRALPFSEAVRAGDFLYLAGQIGNSSGTDALVAGGIKGEARQAMENIKAVLARHAASMDDVVKCTVFLADVSEWAAFNEVYRGYFPKHFPARSALGVNGLAKGARVEVDATMMASKAIQEAEGEEGQKALAKAASDGYTFVSQNIYAYSPKMSYPRKDWVARDPEYWAPKPAEKK